MSCDIGGQCVGLNPRMWHVSLALQYLTSLTITPSRHKNAQGVYITLPDAAVHSV